MIAAVVPAAGQSARMGRPKTSLTIAGRTLLDHVVTTLRTGGVQCIVVVVGPELREMPPLPGAELCVLDEPTPHMRATVERGLQWLEERSQPQPRDYWLLAPADHPAFSSETVRALLAAGERELSRSIVVPVYAGRRGHPTLISWCHVPGIRAMPPDWGINDYVRQHTDETIELPGADAGVLVNLNTPADYEQFCAGLADSTSGEVIKRPASA
jgi:CTP:molybdopterin cytidylyltransferase MocA